MSSPVQSALAVVGAHPILSFIGGFIVFVAILMMSGVREKIFVGLKMANNWSDPPLVIMFSLIGGIPVFVFINVYIGFLFGAMYTPVLTVLIVLYYQLIHLNTPPADTTKYIEFKV